MEVAPKYFLCAAFKHSEIAGSVQCDFPLILGFDNVSLLLFVKM